MTATSNVRKSQTHHWQQPQAGCQCVVVWLGWSEMEEHSSLFFFYQSLRGRTILDVLPIHCGNNDLCKIKGVELAATMKQDP